MAVLSGKTGYVTIGSCSVCGFTNGTLTYGAEVQTYASTCGGSAEKTVAGLEKGSGSFEVVVDTEAMITSLISTGSLVTLTFVHTATGSVQATGNARIGDLEISINRDGSIQMYTVNFTTDGAWTFPS